MKRTIWHVTLTMAATVVQAATTSSPTHYETDFAGDVSGDFCDGAIMEWTFNSVVGGQNYSSHAECTYTDGSVTLDGRYGGDAFQALITGGAQSETLVPVGHDGSLIQDYAYGMFSNSVVEITYTLYNPRESGGVPYNHTDIGAYIAARKNDDPNATSVGPYPYRVAHYLAWYNGTRLSVGEWTYSYGAPPREVAGQDVAIGDDASTFKLALSVENGDDNNGVAAGGSPCLLAAQLWENGEKLAEVSGQDNSYDWDNGPEIPGTTYDPAGDYGQGAWSPYAGDWDDSQSWARGNHDIRYTGWIVFGARQLVSSGTYQGITVTHLSVQQPGGSGPTVPSPTIIAVR